MYEMLTPMRLCSPGTLHQYSSGQGIHLVNLTENLLLRDVAAYGAVRTRLMFGCVKKRSGNKSQTSPDPG